MSAFGLLEVRFGHRAKRSGFERALFKHRAREIACNTNCQTPDINSLLAKGENNKVPAAVA
jgi:hypothetical protein